LAVNDAEAAPTTSTDPRLAGRLRRMRAVATSLLVAMAALYIATAADPSPNLWIGAARAFAEAALIGGLADWFAVTALFRRPLGLPIPHTAIVPTRKDQIGRALARFIRDHFLVRDAIERRLKRTNLATRLGAWLEDPTNSARVSADLGAALDWSLDAGGGGQLRPALGASLRTAFDTVPVSRAIATLLEVLATGERADLLIDQIVAFGRAELEQNRVLLRVRIHEQSPWYVPKFVDQEIYDKIVVGLEELLDSIARDPAHPARDAIKERIRTLHVAFAADPALAAKSRALQEDLVTHPAVRSYAVELWQRFAAEIKAALADDTSALRRALEREIVSFGTRLRSDESLARELNEWLQRLLLYVVDHYRDPLSEIVSETIESWDPEETSRRIELNIGTDLQYIRVNGTLVGGLVGVALYFGALAVG
jgi:uncharacterized membrane-anchored protein YjiN (DUF445 family)